jgi:hypothetical protein
MCAGCQFRCARRILTHFKENNDGPTLWVFPATGVGQHPARGPTQTTRSRPRCLTHSTHCASFTWPNCLVSLHRAQQLRTKFPLPPTSHFPARHSLTTSSTSVAAQDTSTANRVTGERSTLLIAPGPGPRVSTRRRFKRMGRPTDNSSLTFS